MTFREDLDNDFGDILAGDFSARIVIIGNDSASTEINTRGIFDNTFEPVEKEGNYYITSETSRVTIFKRSLTDIQQALIQQNCQVRVFINESATPDYTLKIKDLQPDSEGNLLILLKDI